MNRLTRILRPIVKRLDGIARRAIIRAVKDSELLQELQLTVMDGDVRSGVKRYGHFGLSYSPPVGTECVVLNLGGRREQSVVIATENGSYRIRNLASGDLCIYDARGNKVHLKSDEIAVEHSVKVQITSPLVEASGNLQVGGNISADGDVSDGVGSLAAHRTWADNHTHTGSASAPSGPQTPTGAPTAPSA